MDNPTTDSPPDERVERARALLGAYERDGVAPGYWDAVNAVRGLLQVIGGAAR